MRTQNLHAVWETQAPPVRLGQMAEAQSLKTILVVDDEAILRLVISEALREAGYSAIEASTADEALEMLGGGLSADAVVSDIEMPGSVNGLELAWTVHAHWPSVVVILTSGRQLPRPSELPRGIFFMAKPFAEDRLLDTIARLFEASPISASDSPSSHNDLGSPPAKPSTSS